MAKVILIDEIKFIEIFEEASKRIEDHIMWPINISTIPRSLKEIEEIKSLKTSIIFQVEQLKENLQNS